MDIQRVNIRACEDIMGTVIHRLITSMLPFVLALEDCWARCPQGNHVLHTNIPA